MAARSLLAAGAIINLEFEPVVAAKALVADIQMLGKADIARSRSGMRLVVDGEVTRGE